MKRFFAADFNSAVFSIIESVEKELGKNLDDGYKSFLCVFYTEALAGSLIDWIKNRHEKDRQHTLDYLVKTMRNSLSGIFNEL